MFTQKVKKQKFLAKIWDSYWLFVRGERDIYSELLSRYSHKTFKCQIHENNVVKNLTSFLHTTYSRSNIGQECEGNCGLWVLNEMSKEIYPENLKKIVGAVWDLHAK